MNSNLFGLGYQTYFCLVYFSPISFVLSKFAQTPVVREILFLDNTFSNSKFVLNLLSVLNLNLNLPTTRAKGVKIEISLLLVVNLFYEYNLNTGLDFLSSLQDILSLIYFLFYMFNSVLCNRIKFFLAFYLQNILVLS